MTALRLFSSPHERHKLLTWFLGCFACVFFDQTLKWWIRVGVHASQSKPITSFFTLVHAWNAGISFGLFPCHDGLARRLLLLLAFLFMILLFRWYWKAENRFQRAGLILIMGGAFGNIIDRLRFGAVFDFLYFHWHTWYFPAFNLADMLITAGFLLLIIDDVQWKFLKKHQK